MQLDWNAFTPWASLAGGVLIGLAAGLLVLGAGRIAGISGIAANAFTAPRAERSWRLFFLLGLIAAPWAWQAVGSLPPVHFTASPGLFVAAGLLVGYGTRMGSGCTSGHGVCGIARGSRRSVVATAIFVVTGMATVFVMRHVLALA